MNQLRHHGEMPQMVAGTYQSSTSNMADLMGGLQRLQQAHLPQAVAALAGQLPKAQEPKQMANTLRRLVQVFIADPDENVPIGQCLLYSGEQKLTDLTDQELFFEIDVRTLLEKHNALRVTIVNKSIKERVEHLEAARVRDLKMTVVTIAQF